MNKIVVDSGCDLNDTVRRIYDINPEIVPLTMQIDSELFEDSSKLDVDLYIDTMNSSSSVPKTAAPSPQSYLDKYKEGESVFVVTLSSKLSGSYNSAVVAKNMYFDEIGEKFIHVFDSLSASVGETLIALKINNCIKENMDDKKIVETVENFIQSLNTFFVLEKFDNIVKTGRMNPYVAKIASILSFKPICGAEDGKMKLLGKARGYKKAMAVLIDMILKTNVNFEECILAITHIRTLEKANIFKDEIHKKIKFKDIIILEGSGLCSTYAQDGGIIVSF